MSLLYLWFAREIITSNGTEDLGGSAVGHHVESMLEIDSC